MENYKKIKSDITKIINSIDPWDLISAGAPEDEYDNEINQTISLYLNNKLDKENLEKIWNASEPNKDILEEIIKKINGYFSSQK